MPPLPLRDLAARGSCSSTSSRTRHFTGAMVVGLMGGGVPLIGHRSTSSRNARLVLALGRGLDGRDDSTGVTDPSAPSSHCFSCTSLFGSFSLSRRRPYSLTAPAPSARAPPCPAPRHAPHLPYPLCRLTPILPPRLRAPSSLATPHRAFSGVVKQTVATPSVHLAEMDSGYTTDAEGGGGAPVGMGFQENYVYGGGSGARAPLGWWIWKYMIRIVMHLHFLHPASQCCDDSSFPSRLYTRSGAARQIARERVAVRWVFGDVCPRKTYGVAKDHESLRAILSHLAPRPSFAINYRRRC
ncbi:hypothetical protein B0H10DRAFT_932291 [Mycena sp. CBHHK59/15]|nr:hypothetical protein B0H10DRAFT_932291 [Mycena sp. CBHHK59/15]